MAALQRWRRWYALRAVRFLKSVVSFVLVLSVASGTAEAYALAQGVGGCGGCSIARAIAVEALGAGRLPGEIRASRDSARFKVAVRSAAFCTGVPTASLVLPALDPSGAFDYQAGALSPSISLAPNPVRGPPSAL